MLPTARIKLNKITTIQQTSDRRCTCIYITFLKCTVPLRPVRSGPVRLRFWTISCRQRMLTKGINPRPNIPFQHPAGLRFCVAGVRTAADHIQFHCYISSSSLWKPNSSARSIRITVAECSLCLNKAVNWETELQSHAATNGHCISTRMVKSMLREGGWTRRPVSEHTVTTYCESQKQFVVCHWNISKTF